MVAFVNKKSVCLTWHKPDGHHVEFKLNYTYHSGKPHVESARKREEYSVQFFKLVGFLLPMVTQSKQQ